VPQDDTPAREPLEPVLQKKAGDWLFHKIVEDAKILAVQPPDEGTVQAGGHPPEAATRSYDSIAVKD